MKEHMQAIDDAMQGLLNLGGPLVENDMPLFQDHIPVVEDDAPLPTKPETHNLESKCSFREELMDEILAKRPGLTREKLSRQMAEMGF